jgi:uncharacterized protein YqjF (DUF2071 family)
MPADSQHDQRDAFATPKPRLGPLGASTALVDIAIVTYDVDPDRLKRSLPRGLEPDVVTLSDRRPRALVSAVTFRDVAFRFRGLPIVRVGFVQTNYRAYVRARRERAVWFFGTTLTSRLAAIPRLTWQMPWWTIRGTLDAEWSGGVCRRWRSRAEGRWGSLEVELEGTDQPMGAMDGFADPELGAFVLTHPLVGYYTRFDGLLGKYHVWHERMTPTIGRVLRARYGVFEDAGLVAPGAPPHSVLLQRRSDFLIQLPPRRVAVLSTSDERPSGA